MTCNRLNESYRSIISKTTFSVQRTISKRLSFPPSSRFLLIIDQVSFPKKPCSTEISQFPRVMTSNSYTEEQNLSIFFLNILLPVTSNSSFFPF
jgi:hypothetical protein